MKLHTGKLAIVATVAALVNLSSCSPIAVSPTVAPLNPSASNAVTQSVYAFAPNKSRAGIEPNGEIVFDVCFYPIPTAKAEDLNAHRMRDRGR